MFYYNTENVLLLKKLKINILFQKTTQNRKKKNEYF